MVFKEKVKLQLFTKSTSAIWERTKLLNIDQTCRSKEKPGTEVWTGLKPIHYKTTKPSDWIPSPNPGKLAAQIHIFYFIFRCCFINCISSLTLGSPLTEIFSCRRHSCSGLSALLLFKITPGGGMPPSADSAGPGPQASSCSRAPCTSFNSPEPQVLQLHNNTTFWQYSYLIETKLYSAVIENPVFF